MIQRIQTLYLLAAAVLTAVMLFVPLAWFGDYDRTATMYAFAMRSERTIATAAAETAVEAMSETVAAVPATEIPAAAPANAAPAVGEPVSEPMPPYLGILLVLATLLPLTTIFLFRRRMLQIRLCAVGMVLLAGTLAMEAVYYFRFRSLFAEAAATVSHASLKLPMAFPLLALLFTFLAARAVFRDEMLVRAADRIR